MHFHQLWNANAFKSNNLSRKIYGIGANHIMQRHKPQFNERNYSTIISPKFAFSITTSPSIML